MISLISAEILESGSWLRKQLTPIAIDRFKSVSWMAKTELVVYL